MRGPAAYRESSGAIAPSDIGVDRAPPGCLKKRAYPEEGASMRYMPPSVRTHSTDGRTE